LRSSRAPDDRNPEIIRRLNKIGIPIQPEEVIRTPATGSLTTAHRQAPGAKGVVASLEEASTVIRKRRASTN
jgi:hypothetical protein